MRMMTTGAPVFLAALLAGSAAAAPAPKTLKFNLTTITDAQGMHVNVEGKIWVKRQNVTISQTQTTRISQVQSGVPIPDSLFAVPAGYKIVEAGQPGVPGLPGAPGMGRPGAGP